MIPEFGDMSNDQKYPWIIPSFAFSSPSFTTGIGFRVIKST
jgi:hypothetical protein